MTARLAATALLLLGGAARAQSNVTVYGLLDAGVDLTRAGKGSSYRVISGGDAASRWGIRGAEDLGDGLSAVFKLESAVLLDTGSTAPAFWLRESSVGVSSSRLGTVTMGRTPTPYWMTSWVLDAFVWGTSGGYPAISRSGATTQQLLPLLLNARVDNSLSYVSPGMNGFEFRAQGALGEGSASVGRSFSAATRYAKGAVDVALAWQRQNSSNNANGNVQAIALGGSYDLGAAKAYAGYTNEKNSCSTCAGTLARAAGISGSNASEFTSRCAPTALTHSLLSSSC